MSETKSTPSLESTLKSLDTEEFIDIHFYRPIGYQWALFFNKLGVSPNSITIASIFIGIAAGICFYFQSLAINVIGIFLVYRYLRGNLLTPHAGMGNMDLAIGGYDGILP